jgi:hypothetical protein
MKAVSVISMLRKNMNRRDFAKGLAALPFAGAIKSFASSDTKKHCPLTKPFLLVVLEGPFALAVGGNSSYTVTAFTPRHDSRHLLAVNGKLFGADAKYEFRLFPDGLTNPAGTPCIEDQYTHFYSKNTPCQQNRQDHFVSIDLPAPEGIIVGSSSLIAKMEDSDNDVDMPGPQVLVYTCPDKTSIRMYGSDGTDVVKMETTDIVGIPAFRFEVGLPNHLGGTGSDPNGSHAIDFYNNGLLRHFPALASEKEWRIREITKRTASRKTGSSLDKYAPLDNFLEEIETTTTFECKIAGGLTATLP